MAKCLVVFIALLTILVFIGGCPARKPVLTEPAEVKTLKLEPAEPAPEQLEPDKIEPVYVEPNEIQPGEIESTESEPNDIDSGKTEPNEPEPPEAEPGEVLIVEPEPNDVELGRVEPNEPNEPKPEEVTSTEPEPNEVESTSIEPNNVEPVKVEPNDIKPEPAVSFHDKCAEILKSFVDDKGMVDYKTLKRKRFELIALLDEFNNLGPSEYESWPKDDKIAFWINAHNLQKLKVVTDNYPIKSSRFFRVLWGPTNIRHIEEKITGHKFLVMDEEFTFARIKERFFSKQFDDPRIFLATSDACLSSPPLRNEPYYGHKLNKQLDDQTKRFLSSPLAFRIDRKKNRVYLSAIFQAGRYGQEFVKKFAIDKKFKDYPPVTRAVLNFITNYVSEQDASFLKVGDYTIKYMSYDWTINDGS